MTSPVLIAAPLQTDLAEALVQRHGAMTEPGPGGTVAVTTSGSGLSAEQMAELEGVSEVFSVAGQYDLVALVRVRENDDLARVISDQVRKLPGIVSSETLIAFKVYSKKDIE